jgi:hypothetical protein
MLDEYHGVGDALVSGAITAVMKEISLSKAGSLFVVNLGLGQLAQRKSKSFTTKGTKYHEGLVSRLRFV